MKLAFITAITVVMATCSLSSCANKTSTSSKLPQEKTVTRGAFSADSAYECIERQLSFGPRIPGTESHRNCADFIVDKLSQYRADTIIQQLGTVTLYNGDKVPMRNILARFNRDVPKKILLLAHYDTRPWADQEDSLEKRSLPVPGANDGGSGTAVLLEAARNLSMSLPQVGVDILFVDVEDSGANEGFSNNHETWCLGTQEWVKDMPYKKDGEPLPAYGILLDMVGGKNAKFHREYFSEKNARTITDRIWAEAAALGLDNIFINQTGGMSVVDDHIFVNKAGIKTCNIIENVNSETNSFPPYWHTVNDDIRNISKSSLKAVGDVVLNIIYKEKL